MPETLATLGLRGSTSAESEMVETLSGAIRRFGQGSMDAARVDRDKCVPPELIKGAAALGLFGASIPEEYGGAGLGLAGVCEIVTELARIDRSVATTVGLHLGLGTRGLVAFGSDQLRAELLPGLATGEWVAAFSATEAGAGSDLAAVSTRAVADDDDEDSLRVDGAKVFVTNAGLAEVFTLLVASPGLGGFRRGQSLIALRRGDEGLTFGAEEDKLGLRGSSTRSLYLDGMRVPRGRIIGTPGEGAALVAHVLAWGRTAMAAGCVGAADAAWQATLEHTQTRRQFGKRLADLPVVAAQLADMAAMRYAMRSLVRATGWKAEDRSTLEARSVATKIFCSEGDWELTDTALQLHGGSGFIEESGMPLLLRDARITRIFEGANDVLRIHAGAALVLAPVERLPLSAVFGDDPLVVAADRLARDVETRRSALREAHGARILRQQRLLHQLGSAFVMREATDASVARALVEGTPASRAHALHWLSVADNRLDSILRPLPDVDGVDAVLAAHFAEAS